MYNGNVDFNQSQFFDYANDIKNHHFFVKMMTENGINYSLSPGYCYGLTNEYLLYMINDKGEEYIKQLNFLYNIANSYENSSTSLEQIKHEALKKHAQVLLNELMSDVIKVQSTYQKSVINANYFSELEYTKITNESFLNYINKTIEENYQSQKNSYGKDVIHYTYLYELQKIKLKKYGEALFANKSFFASPKGKLILTDPLYIKLRKQFSAQLSSLGEKYTIDDTKFFINILTEDIQRDNYLKLESHNYRKGASLDTKNNNYTEHLVSNDTLNNFKKKLILHTQKSHDSFLVKFCSARHAMAVSAIYSKYSKSWNYTFFDPNSGVVKFNNQENFINHIDFYVKMNAQQYGFKPLKGNDYEIKIFELKENNNYKRDKILKELNAKDIKATENDILSARKASFMDKFSGVNIMYKSFSPERNLVKIKVTLDKKSFYLYSNILDFSDLQDKVKNNAKALFELKSNFFISDGKYNVYSLSSKVDMDKFNVESIDNVLEQKGKQLKNIQLNKELNYKSINLQLKPIMNDSLLPKIGFSDIHQEAIIRVANKNNIIIGFRPIDTKSTSLINSGVYSSKGLLIKGKSADWGPHSGFIPIQQQYAKKSARIEFEKYNSYIQQSIEENKALAITLEITQERVNELIEYKAISPLKKQRGEGYSRTTSIVDGQETVFMLKKIKQGKIYVWQVYYQDGNEIKPFQVMSDPKTGKAIIADYDMFSIIFPVSQLEDYIKVTEMPTWKEWKAGVVYEELTPKQKKAYDSEVEYNRLEGKDNGIINKKIKEIKNDINRELGRADGFELVHHGADDANPVSTLKDNFPITFFLPDKLKGKNALLGSSQSIDTYFPMNKNGAIVIRDIEQLSNFQQLLINQGYRAPINKNWREGENSEYFNPKRKLSESYLIAYNEIQRKKSLIADDIDKNIEKKLGKAILQLDTDFENINVYDIHNNMDLSGEKSVSIKYINDWFNPLIIYRKWESQSNGPVSIRNTGEYDYNVIIQIAGDQVSAKAVAGAFSKHPDKSMIIQYDITSRQYHILHGDVEKLNTGKIRWLTVGHGIYNGNNQPTSYMYYNSQQFADGLDYLKSNVLNNRKPDKLVLMGCNLGAGGVSENFTIKAVNALAKYGMDMPIVAYNRPISNNFSGVKYVIDGNYLLDIKKHKFIYQYNSNTKIVTINDQPAVLYFINELRRGEIKLYQLSSNIEPNPIAIFHSPENKKLDFDLVRKVAYNPNAYQLFVDELVRNNGTLPEHFYADFSAKLNDIGIISVPRWEMVDGKRISTLSLKNRKSHTSDVAVIVRFISDTKGRDLAEALAAKNPKNTIIFQVDVDSKKWVLEYGEPENFESITGKKQVKWVLIGDSKVIDNANDDIAAGLVAIKKKYPLTASTDMLFHSISPPDTTSYAQYIKFTTELSSKLKLYDFDIEVKSSNIKYTMVPKLPSNSQLGSPVTELNQTTRQQLKLLLEKIALKQIKISEIHLAEHPYLAQYFIDADGQFSTKKIQIALYDPLISPRVYEYLNSDVIENKVYWNSLFETKLSSSLQKQALDSQAILRAIYHDPHVLNNLSEQSKQQLKMLFPITNEFDRGKVLMVTTDSNAFTLIDDNLTTFSRLSSDNFVGENAPLKDLSLAQALQKYHIDQQLRQQQFSQLHKQACNRPEGVQINMIHHGWLRQNGYSKHFDQKLGLLFGLEFQVGDSISTRNLIERKAELEQKYQQGILSESEAELLKQIQNYSTEIENNLAKSGITISDQSILDVFSPRNTDNHPKQNTLLLIKSGLVTFTVSCTMRNGLYEYSLFDPNGFQLSVKHAVPQQAKHAFYQLVKNYFSEEITLPDGIKISRGQHSGLTIEDGNQLRADLQYIDFNDVETYKSSQDHITVRENIIKHIDFAGAKNSWVSFNDEKIPLMKLQNLGVTIDGKPINITHTQQPGWHKKVRFNSEKLAVELTMMDGKDTDLVLLKILRRQLNTPDNIQITDGDASFTDNTILKKQLNYLTKKNVDFDNPEFTAKIIENLHAAGTKLSRFERFSNRFGQVMGGVGIMQSIANIYTILSKLENPDLSEAEYAELEKQFYLTCGNAFFNYGDMVLQPVLLKIAAKYGASSLVRSRLASGTVVVFNLVGMGLDAYQAYECLSKLETTTDPKQRQDLIVSAFFTCVSIGISAATTIAILASSATIPAVGLFAGGLLILRSWVDSAKRHIDSIKSEIEISWSRELEEGIRGAIGLEPTERTQQEIIIKRYIDSFKKMDWQNDLSHFEQTLVQAGFDHHLSVVEKPIYRQTYRYYLVDTDGNYFGGELGSERISPGFYISKYIKRGAPSFTSQEADFLLRRYILMANGIAHRAVEDKIFYEYRKVQKDTFDLERNGSQPTNEYYGFNADYHDPLFTQFKTRHGIQDSQFTLPIEEQLNTSDAEQLNFYSTKTKFGVHGQMIFSGNYQRYSEHFVNNIPQISLYLNDLQNRGSSFNTANGNDIIIGKKNQMNAFQVLSGEKYFAGGNKNDYFYLRDGNLDSLDSNDNNRPNKYLDGQSGNDTLIIDNLPRNYQVRVDLKHNEVNYHSIIESKLLKIAHIKNIENIILRDNTNDVVKGDDNNNIIDGGAGIDKLYGYDGADKLILTQGYANGGNGHDSYQIRRYEWLLNTDDLYRVNWRFNNKTKRVDKRSSINPIYHKSYKGYHGTVVIEEFSQSLSMVNLEYSLSEITDVYVEGKDLYLQIQLSTSEINDLSFPNITSQVTVVLKNVYKKTSIGRELNHDYKLRTRDGFVLNSQLAPLTQEQPDVLRGKLFNITYLQNNDQLLGQKDVGVLFDETKDEITINNTRTYSSPDWGILKPSGHAKNLTYKGNDSNNILSHIASGNRIKVSLGNDVYQINQANYKNGEVIFDFSDIKGRYSKKDRVIIILQAENGYSLKIDEQTLMAKARFGDTKLALRFENFDEDMRDAVLIQDKYGNLFTVSLQEKGSTIVPVKPVIESTDNNDFIELPTGYLSEQKVISGKLGNDIILDRSLTSHILIGGGGDDTIKSIGGNNVLYGGSGVNFMSGGDGNDFLISSSGYDSLMGGVGDDHYLIDGRFVGLTYIDDNEGKNHVHLVNFKGQPIVEKLDDGTVYYYYISEFGKIAKIKQKVTEGGTEPTVHTYSQLPDKFRSMIENGMEPLANYFADKLLDAQKSGELETWQPANEMSDSLLGIPKQLLLTSEDNGINLSPDYSRTHWLIDAKEGNDSIIDQSRHGRVVKGGKGNDKLVTFGGENVLYGGQGNDVLYGGERQDILISIDGADQLVGGKGNDFYLVSGQGKGNVTISDFEGRNRIVLINFKPTDIRYEEIAANLAVTTYQSKSGRLVTIHHNNHRMSMANVTEVVFHDSTNAMWNEHTEQTVDRLTQLLVEQRFEHENTFDDSSSPAHLKNAWGAVQYTEHFLSHT